MAQKTTVPRLVRQGAGNPAADDALDDKRMARYLAQEWADDVAHSCGLGWFMRGTGGLWDCDAPGVQVRNRIRRVLTDASALAKRTVKTRDVARELSDELNVEVGEWNSGNVLGLPDGHVVDLATGETRAAIQSERVYQRLAAVPESGEPTEWLRVLGETFAELAEPNKVIAYVRWWFRYSLGVSCADESILFMQGPPGSGKSTICDLWTYIAGDYAATREGKRLAGHGNQHTQWLAGLLGKRLVRVGELPDGGRWDTGPINALASGEIIEANRMRQDSIEFQSVSEAAHHVESQAERQFSIRAIPAPSSGGMPTRGGPAGRRIEGETSARSGPDSPMGARSGRAAGPAGGHSQRGCGVSGRIRCARRMARRAGGTRTERIHAASRALEQLSQMVRDHEN